MLVIYWERENPIGSLPPRSPAPGSSVAPTGHGLRPGSLPLRRSSPGVWLPAALSRWPPPAASLSKLRDTGKDL